MNFKGFFLTSTFFFLFFLFFFRAAGILTYEDSGYAWNFFFFFFFFCNWYRHFRYLSGRREGFFGGTSRCGPYFFFIVQNYYIDSGLLQTTCWHSVCIGQLEIWGPLKFIWWQKFALSAKKIFSRYIQNVLPKNWTQIILGIIVTKCNQAVQVFSCTRNETGMKILAHGMHMQALCMYMQSLYRHYTVYRHYTSQWAAACNMEERCLFEKLYLCSEKDPLSHTSTERISEQVNGMKKMIFTLTWKTAREKQHRIWKQETVD